MKPPVFIVGCPRSGTGLIRALLRSHPNLSIPPESHFVIPFYKAFGDPKTEAKARQIAAQILETWWFKRWRLELTEDKFAGCRTYRDILCILYSEWAARENKPRWGDKTPQHLTEMPTLLRVFPEARIIHIVRDGRDVALSWLRQDYDPANLWMAAVLWRDWVGAARLVGRSLSSETYLEIRYETLVREVECTMREVCRFIGEPFCEEVLRPTPVPIELEEPLKQVSYTAVVPANVAKWKSKMQRAERDLFESVASGLLKELGYEVEGGGRPIPVHEQAFWWLHHHALSLWRYLRLLRETERAKTGLMFRFARLRYHAHELRHRRTRQSASPYAG